MPEYENKGNIEKLLTYANIIILFDFNVSSVYLKYNLLWMKEKEGNSVNNKERKYFETQMIIIRSLALILSSFNFWLASHISTYSHKKKRLI